MKALLLSMGAAMALGGCATHAPQLAWGKPGVSRVDYGTDVGVCTGLAAMQNASVSNVAGGIDGRNNPAITNGPGPSGATTSNTVNSGGARTDTYVPAGSTYSGMVSADFAQRAATQQRTREMAEQRARAESLRSCLVERGYRQIALSEEQVSQLAKLPKGSEEHLEYLYAISSDPEIVARQSALAK